jgi:TetR/AcrR family transcriptional repressor of nem operon
MPRRKQFCVDDVMQKAMVAFWDHGYRGTSLQDLVECMGINRASLYDTFGGKYALFVKTLHNYNRIFVKPSLTERIKTYSPRQAITGLFDEICRGIEKGEERNGCFIINTALEMSPHDQKISEIVHRTFSYIERNFFRKLIERGQACGEISKSVIPSTTSRTLLNVLIGLRVLSRNRPEKALLNSVRYQVEALLPPGENAAIPRPVLQPRKRRARRQVLPAVAHVA